MTIVDDELFEEEECLVVFIQSTSWDEGSPGQINFDINPVVVYITDPDGKYPKRRTDHSNYWVLGATS